MRTIYERAENVVAWIGPRFARTRDAFSLLEDLYQHRLNKEYVANTLRDRTESLEEVSELLSREYWDRVWVIQEVNSARTVTVQCGRYQIDWLKIKAVQEMLWSDHDRSVIRLSVDEPRLARFGSSILYGGVKGLELPQCDPPSILPNLYTTLSAFILKHSTDPRDKVYALIGLTTARDDPRFVIDYSASVRRVYIDVVKYILASSQKLDVICSINRGNNNFDLPSWIPDWTASQTESADSLVLILLHEGVPFNSSGSSTADVEFKLGDEILIANGILLGSIQAAGRKGNRESRGDIRTGIPILLSWYRLLTLESGTTPAQVDAFCRMIFYDRFSSEDFTDYSTPADLMHKILGAIVLLAEQNFPEEAIDQQLVDLKGRFRILEWWAKSWITAACETISCRRFFISNSDLIGICPHSAEPGDTICILLGCSVPVVLRPHEGYYIFLGEAYVHDYMYGKGMKEFTEGKFQLEAFEIH